MMLVAGMFLQKMERKKKKSRLKIGRFSQEVVKKFKNLILMILKLLKNFLKNGKSMKKNSKNLI